MAVTSGHRVFRSTVLLTVSRIAADLIFLGFYLALSRRFGTEGIGQYSFSLALTALVFGVVTSGLTDYMVREVSRRRAELPHYLGAVLVTVGLASFVAILLLAALVPVFRMGPRDILILALIGTSQLFYFLGNIYRGLFAIHEELSRVSYSELVYKVVIVAVGTVLLVMGLPLAAVLAAFPVAAVVYLTFLVWQARRYPAPVVALNRPLFHQMRRETPPFFVGALLGTVSFRLNPILLNYFHGYDANGVYASASKLVEIVLLCVTFYQMSLFPTLSRLFAETRMRHRWMLIESIRYLVMLALPAAAIFFFAADRIIPLLFGSRFLSAIPVLRILAVAVTFAALRHLLLTGLASMNQQWNWVRTQLVGVTLGLIAGLVLIPRLAADGAAWALLIAEVAGCLFAGRLVQTSIGSVPIRIAAKPIAATVVMSVALVLLRHDSVFIQAPVAGVAYLAVLVATRAVDRETMEFVRGALGLRFGEG
ncbi:MAG TPA: flippase [Gemmatimonadales bacterium]|nr:flippase [Gemmatimonadales bacterium]